MQHLNKIYNRYGNTVAKKHIFTRANSSASSALLEEADLKHVPFDAGKGAGKGVYSDATKGCFLVFDRMSSNVMDAVDKSLIQRRDQGLAERTPYRVADFGTADAGTSLKLMHNICAKVRDEEPNTPIELLYEDQSINDWTSVFNRVHNVIPTEGLVNKTSLNETYGDVYAMAFASFYSQCFPTGSVDVSFSSTAMHWLTTQPSIISGALHSAYTNDAVAKQLYEDRALADFKEFFNKDQMNYEMGDILS